MSTAESIRWSEESLSPSEMLTSYIDKLPLLAVVINGYYGQNEMETFAQDQMMRFHSYGSQKRVVALDSRGRTLSIPANYPIKFEVKIKKKEYSKPKPLDEILINHKLPVTIRFEQGMATNFYIGCNTKNTEQFGDIELKSTYDELFFKGNTINQGQIAVDTMIVVPAYLKIYLAVAVGLNEGSDQEWTKLLQNLSSKVQHLDFSSLCGNMDIMLFTVQLKAENEYASLVPETYVRHDYVSNMYRSRDSYRMESIYNSLPPVLSGAEPLYDCVPREDDVDTEPDLIKKTPERPVLPPRKPTIAKRNKTSIKGSPDRFQRELNAIVGRHSPSKTTDKKSLPGGESGYMIMTCKGKKLPVIGKSPANAIEGEYEEIETKEGPTEGAGHKADINRSNTPKPSTLPLSKVSSPLSQSADSSPLSPVMTLSDGRAFPGRFTSIKDVPRDLRALTVEDIGQCLCMLNMREHVHAFANKTIDGELLLELDLGDLRDDFGITGLSAKKLMKFVSGWRPKHSADTSPSDI